MGHTRTLPHEVGYSVSAGELEGDPMTIGLSERKIDRAEFDQLMLDPHWHNALTDTPEPDRYTVIVNQYRSKDTAWIRNRYIYHSLLGWLTPRGWESVAPVLAWYEEDE